MHLRPVVYNDRTVSSDARASHPRADGGLMILIRPHLEPTPGHPSRTHGPCLISPMCRHGPGPPRHHFQPPPWGVNL